MSKKDWNPTQYLQFNRERLQPSVDLVFHIDLKDPKRILDIGCGPGNSTQVLLHRWSTAEITGIDNSPAMIEKARNDYPDQRWVLMDALKDKIPGTYDIVFSNATIQWIPGHDLLVKKFFDIINNRGVLAIQIPMFMEMPVAKAITRTAAEKRWYSQTRGLEELFTIHDHSYYYDQLIGYAARIEMWETDYLHIMDSHLSILDMIRSTGLKPYLDRLDSDNDRRDFEEYFLAELRKDYPLQKDGRVLFPFKRLFFIAYR